VSPRCTPGTQWLAEAAPEVLCFERHLDHRFLVALNFSSRRVPLGLRDDDGGVVELSTDPRRARGRVGLRDLALGPDEGIILRLPQA
jgi:hypothetical protein